MSFPLLLNCTKVATADNRTKKNACFCAVPRDQTAHFLRWHDKAHTQMIWSGHMRSALRKPDIILSGVCLNGFLKVILHHYALSSSEKCDEFQPYLWEMWPLRTWCAYLLSRHIPSSVEMMTPIKCFAYIDQSIRSFLLFFNTSRERDKDFHDKICVTVRHNLI